jgi:hypothetical protein
MAKSDWDSLCIDEDGKSFTGPLTNKEGNDVEVYKNWLYVHAPKMWVDKSSFTNPTIAQMTEGYINLAGFEIYAARGKVQNSVFCLVMSYKPGDKYERKIEGGIGAYGWEDEVAIILKQLGRADEIEGDWTSGWSSESGNHIVNWETGEEIAHNYETKYVGVTEQSLTEYKEWVKSLELGKEVDEWLAKVLANRQLRFNQFDGAGSVTEIGKETPDEPIMIQVIKQGKI